MFIIAVGALVGLVGMLLAFTRWAEQRVLDPPADAVPAESRPAG